MNKYLVVLFLLLGVSACTTKDEQYYRAHPKALQQALSACPNQSPQGLTCAQAEQIMNKMNGLAFELQLNPQSFGAKILKLQQTLAATPKGAKDQALEQTKQELAERLAIVKWLESPEN
jgi:hypothetical protein